MRKNSKPPEERRRELVAVASRMFQEKGYEAVSVRDILDAVHGAPGMFYYYFKSKQDIYLATIEQYLSERIERRCRVLEDAGVSFDEKQTAFHQLLQEDIAGYMQRFQQGRERSITDDSYKLCLTQPAVASDEGGVIDNFNLRYAEADYEALFAEDYAGPTCVLVSGDTTIENMEYTIRLIYTGSAE